MKKIFEDRVVSDAVGLTVFVIVESVQFLITLALAYSFIPMPLADFIKDLPLKLQRTIQPERETFFYHWFLMAAVAGQAGFVFYLQHYKKDLPRQALLKIAKLDVWLIAIELFAVFKIWQNDDPWWARGLLYSGIGAWLLIRIFWVECQQGFKIISEVMMEKRKVLKWCVEGFVPVLVIACLWVPDIQKVLGRVFVWNQFRNWDSLIMMPGWAYTHGLGLNTDIISSWGIGAVVWISRCSQILGGFDYAHALTVMMVMVIIYYVALYAFLKRWLRSVLLSAAVLAVAIKLQMFHIGISPLIWLFPQDTPVRHWLDIPVLWCLWQHARSGQNKYLPWAGAVTGTALAWQLSTGLCLLAAFWGYLIFLLIVTEYRLSTFATFKDVRRLLFYIFLPLAVMGLTLFLIQGGAVFQQAFWKNTFEPVQLFLQGLGVVSIYSCLYDRHFFAFIAGFVIPVIYAWTLIVTAASLYSKKSPREELFLIPLCIYGLALYTHYLANGSISHYYAVGIPVVMVLGFWLSKIMPCLQEGRRLKVLLLLAVGAWGALFTNIFFVYYPNIFDINRLDWAPEARIYQSQFNFDKDAAMVARLVPASQPAAVIGSFEAQILMQAKRKPFFYYAPLVTSERVNVNAFVGTSLFTQERFSKTVQQIAQQSPEYIFIDRKLFGQWPLELAQHFPGIVLTLHYISQHYTPEELGVYLIAMHKK